MLASDVDNSQTAAIFRTLFGDGIAGRLLAIDDYTHSLYQSELELIQQAGQKRRLEFSTGRHCAKQALADFGIQNFPVLRNEHRDPVWPSGIVGSISHCRDLCGAVVARTAEFVSIGFDIENIKPLNHDIAEHICTAQEKDWLASQRQLPAQTLTLLLFSLKESVFKSVYPQTRIQLGFKDCSIIPDLEKQAAKVSLHYTGEVPAPALRFFLTSKHIYSSAISF